MFLAKIVFAAFTCTTITNLIFVAAQDEEEADTMEPPEEKTEPPPMDHHTFVALLDIVFTDGKKRTCTGTIIHDNVIITAAHCFVDHEQNIEVELTASFVVIGTKKMYDTGYENYLPIERVLTHPRYKGWTADIALVFTFAGMTSEKIGNAIPIVGESTLTPVDSNVTILSWGHCRDEQPASLTRAPASVVTEKRLCTSSEENHDSCEITSTYGPLRAGFVSSENEHSSEAADAVPLQSGGDKSDSSQIIITDTPSTTIVRSSIERSQKSQRSVVIESMPEADLTMGLSDQTTKIISRYLTSEKVKKKDKRTGLPVRQRVHYTPKHRYNKAYRSNNSYTEDRALMIVKSVFENATNKLEQIKKPENQLQKYHKNWRRALGAKESKLSIEIFGFVNVQTCKKLVDRALPPVYAINTNEVVCYAAEEHYINEDDSGSPAIRQGHLVAVTLGGVECEGDHVAVGVKTNCFCSWIAENLPSGGKDMKCCKDCCGETNKEEPKFFSRQRHVNQYVHKPKGRG